MWDNVPISLCISIKYDGLNLPHLAARHKVQEVVKIMTCAPLPDPPLNSFANNINYIYSKFQNDLACIRAAMDYNVKQGADFAMHFYQKRWFGITAFVSKAPKVQEVVKLMASGPLHSLENIINHTCGIYESDSTRIRAVMDQGVKQGTDFAFYFY